MDRFARLQVKTRTAAYKYAWRVGKQFRPGGEFDFVALVDLTLDNPRYWIVPVAAANVLIVHEQLRTKNVGDYEGRWDLLDGEHA